MNLWSILRVHNCLFFFTLVIWALAASSRCVTNVRLLATVINGHYFSLYLIISLFVECCVSSFQLNSVLSSACQNDIYKDWMKCFGGEMAGILIPSPCLFVQDAVLGLVMASFICQSLCCFQSAEKQARSGLQFRTSCLIILQPCVGQLKGEHCDSLRECWLEVVSALECVK